MGKHSGPVPSRWLIRRPVALGMGIVLSALAWCVLVWAAIGVGRGMSGGQVGGWMLLAVAALGAAASLLLALSLAGRLIAALRTGPEAALVRERRRARH